MTTALDAPGRPYQLLPPLDADQLKLLRQSIEENGVLEPVVFDEDGEILDGHHRVEIAEELGIDYPRRVIEDLDETGKQAYALTVNLARRQLTSATRSAHIMRLRQLGMSIRKIADATGMSKSQVARDLDQVSQMGHLPDEVTGADGKTYASKHPAPTPAEPEGKPLGTQTPGPAEADAAPSTVPGPTSTPEPRSEQAEELRAEILRDSERRAAAAGIQSVLTYMTSRVLTPEALAQQYVIALDGFDAEQLRFAAKTLSALADLMEQ